MKRGCFLFDENRCVNCEACIVACANENNGAVHTGWRSVHSSDNSHTPGIPLFHLSMACNHCENPPCLKGCPAEAYTVDPLSGTVEHHQDRCIGCQYCTWLCPFNAPVFKKEKGTVEKCSQCIHRLEVGEKPACAALCPMGALDYMQETELPEDLCPLSDRFSDIRPGLRIRGLRNQNGPEMDSSLFLSDSHSPQSKTGFVHNLSASEEWPLVLFTFISTLVVALFAGGIADKLSDIQEVITAGAIAVSGILSLMHLGKKERAYRAVFNLRSSWLSREVLIFSLFAASVFVYFFLLNIPFVIPVALGIVLLLAIDRLYSTAFKNAGLHSSRSLAFALQSVFLFKGFIWGFVVLALLRLVVFIINEARSFSWKAAVKTAGLTFPCMVFISQGITPLVMVLFFAGELAGRMLFYDSLRLPEIKVSQFKE